jgi:2-iminobutanoate/2-iminopropanoate deaminase
MIAATELLSRLLPRLWTFQPVRAATHPTAAAPMSVGFRAGPAVAASVGGGFRAGPAVVASVGGGFRAGPAVVASLGGGFRAGPAEVASLGVGFRACPAVVASLGVGFRACPAAASRPDSVSVRGASAVVASHAPSHGWLTASWHSRCSSTFDSRRRLPTGDPMPREVIFTPDAPSFPSYSQAVRAGDTVYVAGTIGVDVKTGGFTGDTIQEQTRQALINCDAIVRAAGGTGLRDAVMVHTLLRRPEDADGVNEVFDEFFPDVRPPRCVSRLGVDRPGILVSIAMVAVIG